MNYGYQPNFTRCVLRRFLTWIVHLLRLNNGTTLLATELAQILRPINTVNTKYGDVLIVATNGRLKWRANTMLSQEPEIIDWIDASMDGKSIFLDVGANIGLYSLYALKRGVKYAYCCDLDFMNLSLLYQNLVINSVQDRALILPFAASSKLKLGKIYYRDLSEGDALQSINRPSPFSTHHGLLPHKLTQILYPLDDMFRSLELTMPTHIKIDVDGNEIDTLAGMHNILNACHELYMEYSLEIYDESEECRGLLFDLGFRECTRFPIYKVNLSVPDYEVLGYNIIYKR